MIEAYFTSPFRETDMVHFENIPGVKAIYEERLTPESVERAEVILGMPPAKIVRRAKNLKWLQTSNAGVDNYRPVEDVFETQAALTNISGAFGVNISEWALTMCLALCKKLPLFQDNQNECRWHDEGWQLSPAGKELLILGAGNIGCETARLFRVFGCRITGMRRTARELPENFDAMITPAELDEALPKADIVICALPGTRETEHLLNAERLALLKTSAILINVGRGSLLDLDALARRLQAGLLWGAAVDVTDPEPLPPEHPLWKCRNAIITPHVTGGTFGHAESTEKACFRICRENLERYASGRPLLNRVDMRLGYRVTEDRA